MNATNRGVLFGVSRILDQAVNILDAMSDKECDKENGDSGGAPIESIHGSYSDELYTAALKIQEAIEILNNLVPDGVDFKKYIR